MTVPTIPVSEFEGIAKQMFECQSCREKDEALTALRTEYLVESARIIDTLRAEIAELKA